MRLRRFRDQTKTKLCSQAKFAICIHFFLKHRHCGWLTELKLKNRLFDTYRGDISRFLRFWSFLSEIEIEKCIWQGGRMNLPLQRFRDQTKSKLCLQAKLAICIHVFRKQGHCGWLTELKLKIRLFDTYRGDIKLFSSFW